MPTQPIDLSGQRFGRLTVIELSGVHVTPSGQRKTIWLCRCDCGDDATVRSQALRSGDATSCGCLRRERASERASERNRTHGMSRSPTYSTWMGMRKRCLDPSNASYPRYGARGVRVCGRWLHSFESFLADMGERPPGKTLDRVDPAGDYEPTNCRWATPSEQRKNQRA